jgi:hypothetical protein
VPGMTEGGIAGLNSPVLRALMFFQLAGGVDTRPCTMYRATEPVTDVTKELDRVFRGKILGGGG